MIICAEVTTYLDKICNENEMLMQYFYSEQNITGGFEKRYEELYSFRSELAVYLDKNEYGTPENYMEPKITILNSGHILDHHILGYFAPMDFKRIGFNNILRTPVEQLLLLNQQLKEQNIRFIYVALPCKLAVNPEIAVSEDVIPKDGIMIPQWRKMLLDLCKEGVEIVDCYPHFLEYRNSKQLFTKNHHISPIGADLISTLISDYLVKTTKIDFDSLGLISERKIINSTVFYISGNENSPQMGSEEFEADCIFLKRDKSPKVYLGNEFKSEIAVVGNCNLQSYRNMGCDITANLAYKLNYPVNYVGRYLPFAKIDSIDKVPSKALNNKKILIYIGFPSAAYVRAYHPGDNWSTSLINDDAFKY